MPVTQALAARLQDKCELCVVDQRLRDEYMGIFGNEDEGALDQEMCDTLNCDRIREAGSRYCHPCEHARLVHMVNGDDAALQAWPSRDAAKRQLTSAQSAHLDRLERELPTTLDAEAQEQHAELVRMLAAPIFADYNPRTTTFDPNALDRRCMWCCRTHNESIRDPQAFVQPSKPNYTCRAHSLRLDALFDALSKIERMRVVNRQSTAQVAVYYRYGYLGEYLHQQARRNQQRNTNR